MSSTAFSQTLVVTANQTQELRLEKPGSYVVRLVGQGAVVRVTGRFALTGSQSEKYSILLSHEAPRTIATTSLLGTVKDRGLLQLVGKIYIAQGCVETKSFLTERVLLLSPTAKATVVPDLEILNHEVSCSHAASITTIPESQIFYLQSRGLSREKAMTLLAEGFLLQ